VEANPVDDCALWLLEPVASPADPRWQDRAMWRRVVVAAPSAAFARLAAERWALADGEARQGNESPSPAAGLDDEKLYHARRLSEAPATLPAPGEPGLVLSAEPGGPAVDPLETERRALQAAEPRRPYRA